MRRYSRATIGSIFFAVTMIVLLPQLAAAQDEVVTAVVLEVRGGGTEQLADAVAEIPNVEVRSQEWFVDEVKKSEVPASRLMTRPEDLRFVMRGAQVEYIIAALPDEDAWAVSIYDATGEVARQFEVAREAEAMSAEEADQVRGELAELVGVVPEAPTAQSDVVAAPDIVEPDDTVASDVPVVRPATDVPSLAFGVGGGLLKRSVTYAGDNGGQLSFRSAFYPGARVSAALFPSALSFDVGTLGFVLEGLFARDGIATPDETVNILHIEAEFGLVLQTRGAVALEVGARHARFQLPENELLPSTSSTFGHFGLRFQESFGSVGFQARVLAIPFGLGGAGAQLFGESSIAHGFAGELALTYGFTDAIALRLSNDFRILRTFFPGQGTLDFRDTRAFELVWGPTVGITLAL